MNWFGFSRRSLLGALLGALAGALVFAWGLSVGWDCPYLVGLCGGLGAMILARDRNTMRGGMFAVLAVWVAAVTQAITGPFASAGLWRVSTTLDAQRAAFYVATAVLAAALGSRSIRRGADHRVAGT